MKRALPKGCSEHIQSIEDVTGDSLASYSSYVLNEGINCFPTNSKE